MHKRLRDAIPKARINVNAFASLCFGDTRSRPLRSGAIHRELQSFLSQHSRGLIELPRDHGKSVQVCIRLVWELGRRTDLRIKIVCASEAIAAERGHFIRSAIADNRRVQLVFPDLRPSVPWENVRFSVGRRSPVIGPSVAAFGVRARSTGTRADLLVCDDVVDVTALRSQADRDSVKQVFRENLINLLEPDGRLWYVFTPWHGDDLSAALKKSTVYAHFRRAIGPDLEPIWPEHWSRERLQERRAEIGETAFARAYRLECVAEGDAAIKSEWIQTWTGQPQNETVILAIDPAASVSDRADRSAIVALGRTDSGIVHCLEAVARKVSASDLVKLVEDADRRWRPDVIVFENVAGFGAVYDLLAKHTRFGPKLQPMTAVRQKSARMQAFGVHVQNGRFLLKAGEESKIDPSQIELYDELITFPHGQHDDLADAAAFGATWLLDRPSPRVW